MKKSSTSFTLTELALELLEKLAEKKGLTKTGVVETLIREEAKREEVK